MSRRKGIYQAFDSAGNVTADERWQLIVTGSGACRVESEITRIAPFAEPRIESIVAELDDQRRWQSLRLHTQSNRREAGARFDPAGAWLCWRLDHESGQQVFAGWNDGDIGYNSPVFSMVTIWRSRLQAGESRLLDTIVLDPLTLEPRRMTQTCTHFGTDVRDGPFGRLALAHFEVASDQATSRMWCDADAVIHICQSSPGGGYRLLAADQPAR